MPLLRNCEQPTPCYGDPDQRVYGTPLLLVSLLCSSIVMATLIGLAL